jgi:hypothetical protein
VTEEAAGTASGVKVYSVDPDTGALSTVSGTPLQIAVNPTSIAVR